MAQWWTILSETNGLYQNFLIGRVGKLGTKF